MDIDFRPARSEDLNAAALIVQSAYNDLRKRHGLAATIPLRPPLFQAFCLAECPEGLWLAEAEGRPVGFGFAWTRQRFWFLAQVFVAPDLQAQGVGQALLSRALQLAEGVGAGNRALITMAYNTASTGLYVRNGLYPREPLLRMTAPAATLEGRVSAGSLAASPIGPWTEARRWLEPIEDEVLGFRRESHHAFLLGAPGMRGLRIDRAGRPEGYAYLSADGHIGPLAVAPGADPGEVLSAVIAAALEGRPKQVSLIVPGNADQILRIVSSLGFRVEEPFVLLSARPFGNWQHYLPGNPGLM
jgi:GNAT superfamily N-acetyltransferase